jgi:hypothetical protein
MNEDEYHALGETLRGVAPSYPTTVNIIRLIAMKGLVAARSSACDGMMPISTKR